MSNQPIKHLLIGYSNSSKIITEYSTSSASSNIKKDANKIFSKLSESSEKAYDERNKIISEEGNFFFTFVKPNYIFIVLVDKDYPERLVFQMIYEVKEKEILAMINEDTKELNPEGRQAFKALVDKYQDKSKLDKIADIQADVNEIKEDMKENIQKQMQNIESVELLEEKSARLLDEAKDYKKTAKETKCETCKQNFKLIIIIIIIILLVLAGVGVGVYFIIKKKA